MEVMGITVSIALSSSRRFLDLLSAGFYVVSGYEYRDFLGDFVPFIRFNGPEGGGVFPLMGDVFLPFSGHYCVWCGVPIGEGAPLNICGDCYSSRRGIRFRLIVEGYSSFEDSSVFELESDLIYARYVVYIGVFGNKLKVGVSRFDRGGSEYGFIDRLIEQGFSSGVAFGLFDLITAQDLETDIAREFGLLTRLNFKNKLSALTSPEFSLSDLEDLAIEVLGFIGGDAQIIWFGSFDWSFPLDFDDIWSGDVLCGEVVGYRGNIVFVSDGSSILAVNLNDLVGRGIVDWEV